MNDRGFISVEFGLKGTDLDPLFANFNELVDMCYDDPNDPASCELVDAMAHTVVGRPHDGAYWILRQREGLKNPYESPDRASATESKDTTHVGPESIARARDILGSRMPSVMKDFLEQCVEVHQAAKTSVRPVFDALGVTDCMLAKDPMKDVHLLRVLRYVGTQATHQAKLHFDRSNFTLAAWESHPGLVGAPGYNSYTAPLSILEVDDMASRANNSNIKHRSGEAKVFAGAVYNRLRAEVAPLAPPLPLLLHGVKNERPGEERNALVIFMNHHQGVVRSAVPTHETGIDDLREYVERRDSLAEVS